MRLWNALKFGAWAWRSEGQRLRSVRKSVTGAEQWADKVFRSAADTLGLPTRLSEPFRQHPTVHRILVVFARNVARLPFELFRKGTDEVVTDHPLLKVLAAPCPSLRGTQLWEKTELDLEHYGNALWWYSSTGARPASGVGKIPEEIRVVDPRRVRLIRNELGDIERYEAWVGRRRLVLQRDEVAHFQFASPYDCAWGASWVDAARSEFETDFVAQRWNKGWFSRGAEPSVALVPTGNDVVIQDEDVERLRAQWMEKHGGVGRAHNVTVLPSGLKLEKFGIGHREMDFAALRRQSRENTLSAAGMPPALASILEFANYANMQPQLRMFFELELMPRLALIESVVQADLLDRFGLDLEGRFRREAIQALLEDLNVKANVAVKFHAIGVPLTLINDRLELGFDLEGVEGADVPKPAPAQLPALFSAEDLPAQTRSALAGGERARAELWKNIVRTVSGAVTRTEARLVRFLGRLQREVEGKVRTQARIERALTDRERDINALLFELDEAVKAANEALEPGWMEAVEAGRDTVSRQVGIEVQFALLDPQVEQLLLARRIRIVEATSRMREDLRTEISAGLELGEPEDLIMDRVQNHFGGLRINARTIARTEVHSAFSHARVIAMDRAGVERHVWLSSRDARVRDDHRMQDNGAPIPVGDVFPEVGLRFPLDPAGPPEQVINCRCVTVPDL